VLWDAAVTVVAVRDDDAGAADETAVNLVASKDNPLVCAVVQRYRVPLLSTN
jgi:hypothetical protein